MAHEAQSTAVAAESVVIVADRHAQQTSGASSLDPRDVPPAGFPVWLLWLRSAAFVLVLGLVLFVTWPIISHRLHDQKVRVRERDTAEAARKTIQDEAEAMRSAEEGARRAAEEEAVRCARAAAERRAREEAMRLARLEAERMSRKAEELQARD